MMKNNLFKHEHNHNPLKNVKPLEQGLKAELNQTNGSKNKNEAPKKDESSFKRNTSILAAGGYLFQSHLDDATPSNTSVEAPLNSPDNQSFSALDDRPSVSSRAESSTPTQANDQTTNGSPSNSTANTDAAANTTNPSPNMANTQLPSQEAISKIAPLMQHIASIPKAISANHPQKPLVEITSPKLPTTSLTNQNPLLKIIEPTPDHSAVFAREELLAERKRNKEDRERFNQIRLSIQEFDSREAAGDTAEMYHDLAEEIIDDAYFASLDDADDFEIDEEEVASIRKGNGCKSLKGVDNTIVSTTISAALLTKSHKAEHSEVANNQVTDSDEVTNKNSVIHPNKTQAQLHSTLASANTAIPNYLDIPPKDTDQVAEKSTQVRV